MEGTRDSKGATKNLKFSLSLQLDPTVPNSIFIYCQETGIFTQKTQKY